jgi:hypothetical protein
MGAEGVLMVKLHEIGQFYGERKGWKMFDSRSLTPEIRSYLNNETEFLGGIMARNYDTLVEVGCGYGRYLEWALNRSYSYVGIDIVPWLVDLGQLRIEAARRKHAGADCKILLHPAEEIASLVRDLSLRLRDKKPLIFFPFNCLGNVSSFEAVLDSIQEAALPVVVSTFKTDALSTKIRKDYYRNCGFEQLNSRIMRQGLLMVSAEGFHAMAYHGDWLASAFHKRNFELKETFVDSSVGSIFKFEPEKETAVNENADNNDSTAGTPIVKVILSSIADDPLGPEGGTATDAQLLTFNEITAELQMISGDRLQGTCRTKLQADSILHLALPVIPGKAESQWWVDLVARVTSCEPATVGGFKITLLLNKPSPGLMEKLAGTGTSAKADNPT